MLHKCNEFHDQMSNHQSFKRENAHGVTYNKATEKKIRPMAGRYDNTGRLPLTLNLLAPTTVGARINPYPANVEKMVSS
jgi:hypothetical protein